MILSTVKFTEHVIILKFSLSEIILEYIFFTFFENIFFVSLTLLSMESGTLVKKAPSLTSLQYKTIKEEKDKSIKTTKLEKGNNKVSTNSL